MIEDEKTAKLARRFYTDVSLGRGKGGFLILLDGRAVKTPEKSELTVGSKKLAEEISDEWDRQVEKVDPMSMPMTQMACTTIDRVGNNREEILGLIAKYAETDLLCYRAEKPSDLAERQHRSWQPILDWARDQLDVSLHSTVSIVPVRQDSAALAATRREIEKFDNHELAALSVITQTTGSVIIGLALIHGHISAQEAVTASQVDESYQSELWGLDKEAEERLRALKGDIYAAAQYISLHRA